MELKPGYKQTELGPIPEDWKLPKLGDVASVGAGGTPNRKEPAYWNGAIPWVTTSQVDFNTITNAEQSITELGLRNSAAQLLPPGTLLLALYGQGKTRGKVAILGIQAGTNQACASITLCPAVSLAYTFYSLESRYEGIRSLSNSGSQENLTGQIVRSIPIPLPPTEAEQEAIAKALSDADALIESLEQLVAKKRHLKQGAMQELLTGNKRLPGFGGLRRQNSEVGEIPIDWRAVEIGKIASVKTGPFGSSLHERDYVEDGTPIITVEHLGERGVLHAGLPMVSEPDTKRLSAYSLEEGDIVFSRVGSVDRNARITKAEQGWLFSGRLLRLRRLDDSTDTHYLSYQFHSEPFRQRVRTVAVGQTMASLNTRILKGVMVVLPKNPHEQSAIAAVLSTMDAEIAALESKLAKARQIKQGMMHNLLTGRIRLV